MEKPKETSFRPTRVRDKIETVVEVPKPTAVPPKPVLRSDAETVKVYTALLDMAPVAPTFMNMWEVTAWLDSKYNKWLRQVKHELGK